MRTSQEVDKLVPCLIKAQSEMSAAIKDCANTFYKSNYATLGSVLSAVMPALLSNKICVIQSVSEFEGKSYMTTRLMHESGQFIEDSALIIYEKTERQNLLQSLGSAISYMRRYTLMALLVVNQEDDDGEKSGSKYIIEAIDDQQQSELIQLFNQCSQDYKDKIWNSLKKKYGKNFLWKDFPKEHFVALREQFIAHLKIREENAEKN